MEFILKQDCLYFVGLQKTLIGYDFLVLYGIRVDLMDIQFKRVGFRCSSV